MVPTHVTILSVLNKIIGAFHVLGGALMAFALVGTPSHMPNFFFLIAIIAIVIFIGIGTIMWMMGGQIKEGIWRIPQTVVACLMLLSIPIGTIYGIYALFVVWIGADSKAYFDTPPSTHVTDDWSYPAD